MLSRLIMFIFNLFGAMDICLKLMYKVLAPSIITPYKLLSTYGGSGHIYVSVASYVFILVFLRKFSCSCISYVAKQTSQLHSGQLYNVQHLASKIT